MSYRPDVRKEIKTPKWLRMAAQGPAILQPLLPMDVRTRDGWTSPCNVSLYERVIVYVDVLAVRSEVEGPLGVRLYPSPHLWITVEDGPDGKRWADVARAELITKPGFYRIVVKDLGPFLRLAYTVQGEVRFGVECLGMQLVWLGPRLLANWEQVKQGEHEHGAVGARAADGGPGDADEL